MKQSRAAGNPPTALIIEDNDVNRSLLRAILRFDGIEVVGEARDGETGLDMIERLKPDLVCLDIMLPGMSGLEVLARIRSMQAGLPVLIITGQGDRATVEQSIKGGAAGIVLKPFNAARVIDAVGRCLKTKSAN